MRIQMKVIDPDLMAYEQKDDKSLTFVVGIFESNEVVETGEMRDVFIKGNNLSDMSISALNTGKKVDDFEVCEEWTEYSDKVVLKMGFKPEDEVKGIIYFVNSEKVKGVLDNKYQGYFLGTIGGNNSKIKELSKQVIETKVDIDGFEPLKNLNYNIQHKVGNHLTWALKEHAWGFNSEYGKALPQKDRVGLRTFMDNVAFTRYMKDVEDFKNGKEDNKKSLIDKSPDYRYALKKCLSNEKYFDLSKKMYYTKGESVFINKIMKNAIYDIDEETGFEISVEKKVRNKI